MNLLKPYFLCRPHQILVRLLHQFYRPPTATVRLAWGIPIRISPRKAIGNAIWQTGVFDIAMTEALFRLIPQGGNVLDVGANIGYMTGLMARAAGPEGHVFACEPVPEIFEELRHNMNLMAEECTAVAPVDALPVALSRESGEACLQLAGGSGEFDLEQNEGVARLGIQEEGCRSITVRTMTLDELIGDRRLDLIKLDVEGHELQVLQGAVRLLDESRVTHILFEAHQGWDSDICRFLKDRGFSVFQLSWNWRGPVLLGPGHPLATSGYESPNFLATQNPEVAAVFQTPGWLMFRPVADPTRIRKLAKAA